MTDNPTLPLVEEILRDWENGTMDAAGTIEDLVELIDTAQRRVSELEAVLQSARLQLEYLDEKFTPTGTTPAIIARIDAALAKDETARE